MRELPELLHFVHRDEATPDELIIAWPWIYFHGKAEKLVEKHIGPNRTAPDLVAGPPSLLIPMGKFAAMIYSTKATLYYWHGEAHWTGLICLRDDNAANIYAERQLNKKTRSV